MHAVLPFTKVSTKFLYQNPIGRILFTEEGPGLWTGCSDPYASDIVKLAIEDKTLEDDQLRKEYVTSIPRAKSYKGLLLQGYMVSPKFLLSLETFEIRPDDVFVISYPRSGTTWTEEILSSIYEDANMRKLGKKQLHFRVFHLEVGQPYGQERWLNGLKSPRLFATHLPFFHVPKQLQEAKCKVIYVIRNPKDHAVSYYHYHETAKYLGGLKWNWQKYLQLYKSGHLAYGSWYDHVKGWWVQAQRHPDKTLVIAYEEMKQDLPRMIRKIADFVGKPQSESSVSRIAEHCSFNQMKNNPSVNRTSIPVKNFIDQTQTKFFRKGLIGDWVNYFSEEESREFDQLFDDQMKSLGMKLAFTTEEAKLMMEDGGRIINLFPDVEQKSLSN